MKIKRIVAQDMKNGLRLVREQAGADAVILSQKQIEDGIEILCAIDYDAENVTPAEVEARHRVPPRTAPRTEPDSDDFNELWQNLADDVTQVSSKLSSQISAKSREAKPDTSSLFGSDDSMTRNTTQNTDEVMDEIRQIKQLFEHQLSILEWTKFARRHPHHIVLMQRLTTMGLEVEHAQSLVDSVPTNLSADKAWAQILELMESQLVGTEADLVETGGVVAVVGPTGVGKTTSVAKIAARYALKHGCQNVALISTDNYRIGAQEQLKNFGKILGVPVHHATDHASLQSVLARLTDKQLVLIDTAGMSQRDVRLVEQLKTIGGDVSIKTYVVLSAITQTSTLDDVVNGFSQANLAGCIITKVDEATRIGGILSTLNKYRLPLLYVGTGQRVPEDLQHVDRKRLVKAADKLGQSAPAAMDKDVLAAFCGESRLDAAMAANRM